GEGLAGFERHRQLRPKAIASHDVRVIDTVIIGAGHAGLAVSKRLVDAGIDHVVLERGDIAETWRTQRWDSFALNTPSAVNRLPECPEGPRGRRDDRSSRRGPDDGHVSTTVAASRWRDPRRRQRSVGRPDRRGPRRCRP